MSEAPTYPFGVEEIQRYLPHRSPFLLIDRVLGIQAPADPTVRVGIEVRTRKNASFNEPHMVGHFPQRSLTPGVLILETMAQTASMSLYPYVWNRIEAFRKSFQCILAGADSVRFRRPVVPGDTMEIKTVVSKVKGSLWIFDCEATVDGQRAAEAEILANLVLDGE
ncbi:MAG TPA: 3-hydroxyacyl-ACP dehydratase FabZ, partial [Bdellovibrionota bacterium]|nr:3-hydroxyacyl-ACP dehydratase FabZ [Bdellovibrionota bacterium]